MTSKLTIYTNADFVPMTGEQDSFEALLASDEKILFTGSLKQAQAMASEAEIVDLEGACVLPGLIDPHSHISGASQYFIAANLTEAKSFDDICEIMTKFADENPDICHELIMGVLYDQNALVEMKHPTKEVLDKVSKDKPVVILHASNHMLVANTAMLKLAGITKDVKDPEGSSYGRDLQGNPNGYCEEPGAMAPVYVQIKAKQNFEYKDLISKMQDVYLSRGITTTQDGATTPEIMEAFADISQSDLFKMDVVVYPMFGRKPEQQMKDHKEYDSQEYHCHLRIGGYKMFLDGSPQGRTAWTSEPYLSQDLEGQKYCGYPTMTDDEVYEFCRLAIDSNHQILAHCNGDAASQQYLDQYEKAYKDSQNPDKDKLRPVMVHCQLARKDQYERMVDIHMVPSIFVSHCYHWGDIHIKNFGTKRAGRISAVADAKNLGLPYTFHPDTPVILPNLFEALWCSVVRRTKSGVALNEDQRISVYEGLKAITVNGAYQYGEEKTKGSLEPGKLCDLCVVNKNPLVCDIDEIRDLKVIKTIKENRVVWEG